MLDRWRLRLSHNSATMWLGMNVLHADEDFDLIVNLTNQPAEWLRLDDNGDRA
jgi:hypothetical protein